MAIRNDPRMYTGGSVVMDTRPHIQLYANLLQREQAKNEAFDEYIRNLNKGINTAGVRNQDRPVLEQKIKEWQDYGIKNRDNIRNPRTDNGNANMAFMSGFRDIQNMIGESKQEEEKKKPLIDILTDPTKRELLSEDVIPLINKHDQPLYVIDETGKSVKNPERKSFDISSVSFNPKPFDQGGYFKKFTDVKRTDLLPQIVKDPKTMTQTITKTSSFDENAKDIIATRATSDYFNDRSFRKFINELNPDEYKDFYKQQYGKELETMADLAAAFTLKGMQQSVSTSEIKPDTFSQQVAMENIRQRNREKNLALSQRYKESLVDYRSSKTKKDAEGVLNKFIQEMYNDGGDKKYDITIDGNTMRSRIIKVPLSLKEKYASREGGEYREPDIFWITEDKKYVIPMFYKRNKKGKILTTKSGTNIFDKNISKPILLNSFKADLSNEWLGKSKTDDELMDEFNYDNDEEVIVPEKSKKATIQQGEFD